MTACEEKKGGTGLKFIPVHDLGLVPRSLVELVPDTDADRFFALAPVIENSPLSILGVFADTDHNVRGFLWATANPLDMKLHVNMMAVAPEFQGKGILGETKNILLKVARKHNLSGLIFRTKAPEKFEKWGATRTGIVELEV